MIMLKSYSDEEVKIFESVKQYFETLPPIANDSYKNAFYDLVAQYGCGGEDYIIAESLFSDLVEVQSEIAYERLSVDDKQEIKMLYEKHYIGKEFYHEDIEEYIYDTADLALYISDNV